MSRQKDIDCGNGVFARRGRKRKHLTPITTLYESNYRNPVATLRRIAREIESGKYGDVREFALVLSAQSIEVFSAGPASDGASTVLTLELGKQKIVSATLASFSPMPPKASA